MDLEAQLDNYANLIVRYGLNVQPNQVVHIGTEIVHRDLAIRIAKQSYSVGARFVNLDFFDTNLMRVRVTNSRPEDLSFSPGFLKYKYDEMVNERSASLKIIGSENPDALIDLDSKSLNTIRNSLYESSRYFHKEGISKNRVHWAVVGAATLGWARKIFPDLLPEEAYEKLWVNILKVCRADREDCIAAWIEHNDKLRRRANYLNDMRISELHFFGPGTDLRVGISQVAKFKGGTTESPLGVEFEPNMPTEEVFTTPDWRKTRGQVRATRPFLINGTLVRDWEGKFEDGILTAFDASSGKVVFEDYMNSDIGGNRLGEVALVGIDSPVFQSGFVFQEILYDENAACHIAIGAAYKFCLVGSDDLSQEEIESLGCNESSVHTDMMISDESVDVTAMTYGGEVYPLIRSGAWCIPV